MNSKVFTSASIIVSVILIIIIGVSGQQTVRKKSADNSPAPVFSKERHKYFWDRLKDPATGRIPSEIRKAELNFVQSRFVEPYMKSTDRLQADEVWKRRGPYEIGGRTRAFTLDTRDENIIIAGGVSSGMWKSVNNGASWYKTSLPSQIHSVSCIAQDKRNGRQNTWYYGTGELWGNSAAISGDGIFKSTDNGESWTALQSTVRGTPQIWESTFDYCWNIVTNPIASANSEEVMVATASFGINRSVDGGTTWKNVLGGSNRALFSDVAVTSSGSYYATISSDATNNLKGIFHSNDGIKWVNITPPNFPTTYKRIVIAVSPSDNTQVYFLAETPGSGKLTHNSYGDELWHTLLKFKFHGNDGNSVNGDWEDRSQNLPDPVSLRGQMNSQGSYNLVIKVKPDNPDVVFIGAVTMYRSNSGFKNSNDWSWIGGTCPDETCDYVYRYENHHADLHQIVFSNTDYNVLYTGSDGGIHKTLDNTADKVVWLSLNNGYFTTQFYTVAIDHGAKLNREIIGGLQDNGTLLSRSPEMTVNPWTNPFRGDGFYCQIPDNADYYYVSQNSTWQPKIKISRVVHDLSGNNTISTRIDPIGGADFIWNTPFVLDPNNNNIMYLAGGKMLWRNNNLSEIPFVNSNDSTRQNWDSLSHTRIDFINKDPLGERITAVSVSKNPANIVYYGTNSGKLYKINNANSGDPTPVNVKISNFNGGYVSSIAIDKENADNVVVSFSNYNFLSIYSTVNGGSAWTAVAGNLEQNPDGSGAGPGVNWINILKVSGKNMYFAGTTAGLFSTAYLNGKATVWQMEGTESIGNVVVHMIDSRPEDGYIVVGTHGTGVFEGFYKNLPALPEKVTLSLPVNNSKNILSTVNLKWNSTSSLKNYDLEIAKDANFIDIIHTEIGITNNEFTWNEVQQGKVQYFWRVRNVSTGGPGEFSEIWNFSSAIQSPELVYPADGGSQIPLSFTFRWNGVEGATAYHFQAATGFDIDKTKIDTIISETEFTVENFDKNRKHVWRVSSIENEIEGGFSELWSFLTTNSTSVGNSVDYSLKMSIEPNPVNEFAYISIETEKMIKGRLLIFDVSGRVVQIFADKIFYPGSISIPLNSAGLTAGLYNIVFITDDRQLFQKMQIVR